MIGKTPKSENTVSVGKRWKKKEKKIKEKL